MFIPRRIIFEKGSLDYEMGKNIYNTFKDNPLTEIIRLSSNRIKENIPGKDLYEFYREGKNTLVVGTKKGLKFQSCKPSANYQLPLISGCMGHCEYCYLNTNLGDKPYIKINVNIDDILYQAEKYIREGFPEVTVFEGSATSDPIPVEPYTHSLSRTIEFFAQEEKGRFRFVTKYDDVETLLNLRHNNHTEIRFTLNTERVIKEYESRTSSLNKRIEAAVKVSQAGYPVGFTIAPVFFYDNWKSDYRSLLNTLHRSLPKVIHSSIGFEIISHRYTSRAKNIIEEIFPETKVPMKEEERIFKYGQFGYGKYIYTSQQLKEMKEFFKTEIESLFESCRIKYII